MYFIHIIKFSLKNLFLQNDVLYKNGTCPKGKFNSRAITVNMAKVSISDFQNRFSSIS